MPIKVQLIFCHQIEYKHSHRNSQVNVFDIKLYDGQSQKLLNNGKIKYIQSTRTTINTTGRQSPWIYHGYFTVTDKLQCYTITAGI